jgi:DNA-3-methyladenine glycosylase II
MENAKARLNKATLSDLSIRSLRACGLSGRKATAIREFGRRYDEFPDRYHRWHELPWQELRDQVVEHWGIADWTAEMLAIFYLGHKDVFPSADGSLLRLENALVESGRINATLAKVADGARPFRSVFALYCWRAVDEGRLDHLNSEQACDLKGGW